MKKQIIRLLAMLIVLVLMLQPMAGVVRAANEEWTYTVSRGEATITGYTGSAAHVVVPAELGGFPVVNVGTHTFRNNNAIHSITFSEGIRNLFGEWALQCNALEEIHYSSTITMGSSTEGAISGLSTQPLYCTNVKKVTVAPENTSITVFNNDIYTKDMKALLYHPPADPRTVLEIPDGVTVIESDACSDAQNLKEVKMPNSVTFISYWAFSNAYNLEKVNISESCTFIGQYAFGGTALKNIHIPASVEGILGGAFYNVPLQTITVAEGNPVYSVKDGALYGEKSLVTYPAAKTEETFEIHNGTEVILCYAISYEYDLKKVVIPASVKQLDFDVFFLTGITDIWFLGNAPEFNKDSFRTVNATVHYPSNNATWTADKLQNYGGEIRWVGYVHEHEYDDYKDTTCNICGYKRTVRPGLVPVWRLYNPYTHEHLLTGGEQEKKALLAAGWSLDGIAWEAPEGGSPVYRLYNPYDDWHTYTVDEKEKNDMVAAGWKLDGPISCTAGTDGKPIYRLFNPYVRTNFHLFTASIEERDMLVEAGWILEGIAWYAIN